jgi:hypothetical protein
MVLRYWLVINYPGFSLYLYRIVSGSGYTETKRMTLLK